MFIQVGSCDHIGGIRVGQPPVLLCFAHKLFGGGLASRKMINFRPSETTFRIVMNWLPHVHTLYVHVLRHSHTWLISNIH